MRSPALAHGMTKRVWVLCCALLVGCAATSRLSGEPPRFLFQDDSFTAPAERFSASGVFAVSDAMRQFLATDFARQLHTMSPAHALLNALYTKGKLRLDYDPSMTRNASEAFDARAGNCLSLVIMTAAFAKELDLQIQYKSADTDEVWSRSGDLLLGNGHVNLTIGSGLSDIRIRGTYEIPMTVDFLPSDEINRLPTREIPETTVVAMYLNNKSVEALTRGQLDEAYGWVREAIRQGPEFASSYNTLGVIYLRHGDLGQAARVLGYVLEREPNNTTVLSNLADVQTRLGNEAEAASLRSRLARIDPHPPYYYFNLGMAAMGQNDFRAAKSWFVKEVARADYNDEFHFWLGVAYFKLGEIELAQRQLLLAIEKSSTRGDRDRYSAKLSWLRSKDHAPDDVRAGATSASGPMRPQSQ
jgi:tetratricopeptide (TPR) repeat protein